MGIVTSTLENQIVEALFIVLHFFGVVRSEELQRKMVKFQGFKENVNIRRSIFRLRVISYFQVRDSKARKTRKNALKPLSARGRGSSTDNFRAQSRVSSVLLSLSELVITSFFEVV